MTFHLDHSDSIPQPDIQIFAQPKLILPGVTKGKQRKLKWSNNPNEIDILAARTLRESDDFFR
jgi:hypothetical protein